MNPLWLFPLLAIMFALAATWRAWRHGGLEPASKTWLLLALVFSAVSIWLRVKPG